MIAKSQAIRLDLLQAGGQFARLFWLRKESHQAREGRLTGMTSKICGINSVGRVSPSQGESREFEPRIPLHVLAAQRAAFFARIVDFLCAN